MIELFHISDLHIGKTTAGAKRLVKNIFDKYEFSTSANKYLIVTGDITQGGDKKEYKTALEALLPFKKRIFFVPGNHDYGSVFGFLYDEGRARYFDDFLGKELDDDQKYFDKKPFKKILADGEGNQVLLLGLNSCLKKPTKGTLFQRLGQSFGLMGYNQLRELNDDLNDPQLNSLNKILYLHHIPHMCAEEFFMDLLDHDDLLGVVSHRVNVLAFGHEGSMPDISSLSAFKASMLRRIQSARSMCVRTGIEAGISGVDHVLDANNSVTDCACYHIVVTNNKISKPTKEVLT